LNGDKQKKNFLPVKERLNHGIEVSSYKRLKM